MQAGGPEAGPASPGPAFVLATREQAAGAVLRVGGLTILERAMKQLRARGHLPVVVASDGEVPLPDPLPAGVEVRRQDAAAATREATDRGAPLVAADVVRPGSSGLDGGIRVVDEASRRRAEDAIFAQLLRGDLGLVARHLNKPVSFRITRHVLCRLPITPNQITLGAALVGAIGCALIATGRAAAVVTGFALQQVQSVLDGCDGELARVRFQRSVLGAWLDNLVDDALNLALTAATAVALVRHGHDWAGPVGWVSCLMLLVSNVIIFREMYRQRTGGDMLKLRWWFSSGEAYASVVTERALSPLALLLTAGRRDFFILASLVLAVFGALTPILVWAAAQAFLWFGAALVQLFLGGRFAPAGPGPAS